MTRRFIFMLTMLLTSVVMMAGDGTSCTSPIQVTPNYQAVIADKGEYWYTAQTYDLPINVRFIPTEVPAEPNKQRPVAYVDFSCNGVYTDPNLQEVIEQASTMGKELPYELTFSWVDNGSYYELNIPRKYRDQLAMSGLTYSVPAVVKVLTDFGGNVQIKPDTIITDCNSKKSAWVNTLPRQINVEAGDSDTYYILPFADWKNDSVQLRWQGLESDLEVWFGADNCAFEPKQDGAFVLKDKHYVISRSETLKFSPRDIESLTNLLGNGGVYYTKFLSSEDAELIIERVPQVAPQGNAKQLKYEQSETIVPNDTVLYYFLRKWEATRFVAETDSNVIVYIGSSAELDKSNPDTYMAAYKMEWDVQNHLHFLDLSKVEMKALTSADKKDDYLYVRFESGATTTLTPHKWNAGDCENETYLLRSGVPISLGAKSTAVYRMRYEDWTGGDIEVKRTEGQKPMTVYVGDTCKFNLTATNSHVNNRVLTLNAMETKTWDGQTVSGWASKLKDADGFFYVRCYSESKSTLTFTLHEAKIDSIAVVSKNGVTTLDRNHRTLEFKSIIYPSSAAGKKLRWSIIDARHLVEWNPETRSIYAKTNAGNGTVTIVAEAVDGSGKRGELVVNVKNIATITDLEILGPKHLYRQQMQGVYSVRVTPNDAAIQGATWSILEGDSLVIWDGVHPMLTARQNMHGGVVRLMAVSTDNTNISDTMDITVDELPQWVESIKIETDNDRLVLSNRVANLTVTVGPEDAMNPSYEWHVLVGETEGRAKFDEMTQTVTMLDRTPGVTSGVFRICATAVDGSKVSDTLTISVVYPQAVEEIMVQGALTIGRQNRTETYRALVLPEDAENREVNWSIEQGLSLIEWDGVNPTLTAKMNKDGGDVILRATANDGSGVYGAITIHVDAIPILVDSLVLSVLEGTKVLSEQTPTLHLLAALYPETARAKTVTWSVEEGAHAVSLNGNEISLVRGNKATSVVVRATADDEGAASATMILTTRPTTAPLEGVYLDTYEQLYVLSNDNPQLHVDVIFVPENPDSRDVVIEIVEGQGTMLAPLESYVPGMGFTVERVRGGVSGEALLRATSKVYAQLYDDLRITVVADGEQGLLDATTEQANRRLIMRDGHVYIEVKTDAEVVRYDLLGRK